MSVAISGLVLGGSENRLRANVLVFPCGSEIGLEIHRSVSHSSHFAVHGASSAQDHGQVTYDLYTGGLPFVGDADFVPALNRLVAAEHIDLIVPAHDDAVLTLARAQADGSLGCRVVTSELATCEIARSKRATYAALSGVIKTPRLFDEVGIGDLPIFVKPDRGQGSKGAAVVDRMSELESRLDADPELLMLELLPGDEYTVDCFTDRHGALLYSGGRQRQRVSNGISVRSAFVDDPQFDELAEQINESLRFRGAWFFQLKRNGQGDLVLLEVAPRVAGTMGLSRCRGVNLVLLSLFDALDQDVTVRPNAFDLVVDRALTSRYSHDVRYQHVYLDLDDFIIVREKVSPLVAAFMYQCINNGVRMHLLTRHRGDLPAILSRHRLSGMFDEIVHLRDDEEKHEYVLEQDAIFLDDSFAEREAVHRHRGVPTFDVHAVEALLEAI